MDAVGSIVLFVIVPMAIALIVVAFVLGPSWSRAGRWRPGEPWRDDAVLLGGGLVEGSTAAPGGDGDVPAVAHPETSAGVIEAATATGMTQFGGARGRW